ncbi:MAG TPA: GGDEF domain-containing phosphodiesterase [Cellvibrio sp.]
MDILTAIAQPINVDGNEVRVAASCGIAQAPAQAQEALELVGNADLALFKAKSNGRGRVFMFVPALRMEVTENIVLDNDDIVLEILQRLRQQGVGIAFDDFGTGYASLSLLKTYPLSRIKIDKSFVRGILTSKRDASVVRAIIDMARNFDLQVIAEGIETEAEYNYLCSEQCNEAQGYLFGAPMPVSQFESLLGIDDSVTAIA